MPKIPEHRWWERDAGGAIIGSVQHRRLDQTENAINELAVEHGAVHRQLSALFALDRAQGRDIDRLQAVVGLLLDIVIEKGLVDEATLTAQLTELAEAFPDPALEPALEKDGAADPFVIAPRKDF